MALTEPLVARVTGVKKQQIVALRQALLSRPADWDVERNIVVYSRAGLEKILVRLRLKFDDLPWSREAAAGPQAEDGADTPSAPTSALLSTSAPAPRALQPVVLALPAIAEAPLLQARQGKVVSLSRNPTLLLVEIDARSVLVRVRENKNFLAGMPVQIRAPGPGGEVWAFEGRLPRFKGRY